MIMSMIIQFVSVLCLSLTNHKHYKGMFAKPQTPKAKMSLLLVGSIALTSSLILSLAVASAISISLVLWITMLSFDIVFIAVCYLLLAQL